MELPFELSFGLIAGKVVWIDGRIYWQSSWGLGRSCRRTGRPWGASCAFVCRFDPKQDAIDAMCLFDDRICRRRIAIWFACLPPPVFLSVCPNGCCLIAAGSATDIVDSQSFWTFSTRKIAFCYRFGRCRLRCSDFCFSLPAMSKWTLDRSRHQHPLTVYVWCNGTRTESAEK